MTLIVTILIFLLLSAIFSGSEIAFISANKLKIELQKENASRQSKIISSFYERPKEFLSSMLVGNNIALVVFTYLTTKLLEPLMSRVTSDEVLLLLLNTLVITGVVLIFGEFLPKTLFRLYANRMLNVLSYPLLFFKYILSIPSAIMTWLSNVIMRYIFRVNEEAVEESFTQKDLEYLVASNISTDLESEIDTDLFTNALHLKTVRVKACMVPRTEIVTVDVNAEVQDLVQLFDSSKISRIIVVDDDIENVLGYIHHQQLLSKPKSIKALVLDINFVPETMSADALLNTFSKRSENIACVVDEFGGIAGIITMEDILEELFGEIEDEHDEEELIDIQVNQVEWLLSGRHEVSDLNEKYEALVLPESTSYTTLSGYLVDLMEDIPDEGETIVDGDYHFKIEEVSDTRIDLIRVTRISQG